MKLQVSSIIIIALLTSSTVHAGTARIRIEQDGDDVKITERGRFDWRGDCPSAFGSGQGLSNNPGVFYYGSDDGFFGVDDAYRLDVRAPDSVFRLLECNPTKVECDILFIDKDDSVEAPFDVVNDSFKSLGIGGGFSDDFDPNPGAFELTVDRKISPGDYITGTGMIENTDLDDLDLADGDTCRIRFQDGTLFKTRQELLIVVGSCDFFCEVGETIYDFLGDLLFWTYIW